MTDNLVQPCDLIQDCREAEEYDFTICLTPKDADVLRQYMFRWGYAKEIPMEIIQYGDPDNSGKDLKGYNQIYIRAEAYLGWGILDGNAFARVVASA